MSEKEYEALRTQLQIQEILKNLKLLVSHSKAHINSQMVKSKLISKKVCVDMIFTSSISSYLC